MHRLIYGRVVAGSWRVVPLSVYISCYTSLTGWIHELLSLQYAIVVLLLLLLSVRISWLVMYIPSWIRRHIGRGVLDGRERVVRALELGSVIRHTNN